MILNLEFFGLNYGISEQLKLNNNFLESFYFFLNNLFVENLYNFLLHDTTNEIYSFYHNLTLNYQQQSLTLGTLLLHYTINTYDFFLHPIVNLLSLFSILL